MQLQLTRIGNSRGIRIPKPLIEQCGLGEVVEARVTPDGLMLVPRRTPRSGWKQTFEKLQAVKDELLLDRISPNAFDAKEWSW
jgi:antitoxin MazE